jgi:hypothetical protein
VCIGHGTNRLAPMLRRVNLSTGVAEVGPTTADLQAPTQPVHVEAPDSYPQGDEHINQHMIPPPGFNPRRRNLNLNGTALSISLKSW